MVQQDTPTAFCMKCREKRDVQNPQRVELKNGRPALKGKCGVCDTGIFKLVPMNKGA